MLHRETRLTSAEIIDCSGSKTPGLAFGQVCEAPPACCTRERTKSHLPILTSRNSEEPSSQVANTFVANTQIEHLKIAHIHIDQIRIETTIIANFQIVSIQMPLSKYRLANIKYTIH